MSYEQELKNLVKLRNQVKDIQQIVNSKAKNLQTLESQLRQSQLPVSNARDMERNMHKNLGPLLTPGNLGDINRVIWPFFFTTDTPEESIGQNQTFQTGFSVTQEAAFILMSFTKTVYLETDENEFTYADPNDSSIANNLCPGLTFTLRDGSSSRQLFNTPIEMGHYGNPRFPTILPRPIMFLPNQNVQIAFTNTHPTNLYLPKITCFGYRIRVEDAQNFLGLVYA